MSENINQKNMEKLPTVEEAGTIAVSLSEDMEAIHQAYFVAGFQEAVKMFTS